MKSRKEHISRPPRPPPEFDRPASWYNRYVPVVGSRLRISCHVDDFEAEDVHCSSSDTMDSSSDIRSVSTIESPIGSLRRPLEEFGRSMVADLTSWHTHNDFGMEDFDSWSAFPVGGQEDSQFSAVVGRQRLKSEHSPPLHHQSTNRQSEPDLTSTDVAWCLDGAEADQLKTLLPKNISPHHESELHRGYAHQSFMHGGQTEQTVDPKQLANIAEKCVSMVSDIKPHVHPVAQDTSLPGRDTLQTLNFSEPAKHHYPRSPSYIAMPANIESHATGSNSPACAGVATRAKSAATSKSPSLLKRRTDHSSTPAPATPFRKRRSARRSASEQQNPGSKLASPDSHSSASRAAPAQPSKSPIEPQENPISSLKYPSCTPGFPLGGHARMISRDGLPAFFPSHSLQHDRASALYEPVSEIVRPDQGGSAEGMKKRKRSEESSDYEPARKRRKLLGRPGLST